MCGLSSVVEGRSAVGAVLGFSNVDRYSRSMAPSPCRATVSPPRWGVVAFTPSSAMVGTAQSPSGPASREYDRSLPSRSRALMSGSSLGASCPNVGVLPGSGSCSGAGEGRGISSFSPA